MPRSSAEETNLRVIEAGRGGCWTHRTASLADIETEARHGCLKFTTAYIRRRARETLDYARYPLVPHTESDPSEARPADASTGALAAADGRHDAKA